MRRVIGALLMVALLASCAAPAWAQSRPNFLFIVTDDQAVESFKHMPFLEGMRRDAVTFHQYFHTFALCCPSRTSILTGMYPHNHGVLGNKGPEGGWPGFDSGGLENYTWALALKDAGYDTAMLGKFLNGYKNTLKIPLGWTHWFAAYQQTFNNYEMNDNGAVAFFGAGDSNYSTNVLSDRADQVIRNAATNGRPFAVFLTPLCPHYPATPARKYLGQFANEPFVIKPNFNEADVSDKPLWVQRKLPLTAEQQAEIAAYWRKTLECGLSTDDAIKRLWNTLSGTGQLDNTYIFLTTDNGYMFGEHRIPKEKNNPYLSSIRSRLYVFGPGIVAGNRPSIIANIDIAPTILELAGQSIPNWVDGRSVVPLLTNKDASWRNSLFIQGWPARDSEGGALATDGQYFAALVARTGVSRLYTYHRLDTTETEFYDIDADPYQLNNAVSLLAPTSVTAIEARMNALAACAGDACRATENMPAPNAVRTKAPIGKR